MANSTAGTLPAQLVRHCDLGPLAYLRPDDIASGVLHVRDEKAAGTAGGTNVAADYTQTRTVNTVVANTISGASLASDTVTLPPGTYDYDITAPAYQVGAHQAALYNTTTSSYVRIGTAEYTDADTSNGVMSASRVRGRLTLTSAANFKVRHYTQTARTTAGLGLGINTGQVNVFTEAIFTKVLQ